jgi:hypothetical protein
MPYFSFSACKELTLLIRDQFIPSRKSPFLFSKHVNILQEGGLRSLRVSFHSITTTYPKLGHNLQANRSRWISKAEPSKCNRHSSAESHPIQNLVIVEMFLDGIIAANGRPILFPLNNCTLGVSNN